MCVNLLCFLAPQELKVGSYNSICRGDNPSYLYKAIYRGPISPFTTFVVAYLACDRGLLWCWVGTWRYFRPAGPGAQPLWREFFGATKSTKSSGKFWGHDLLEWMNDSGKIWPKLEFQTLGVFRFNSQPDIGWGWCLALLLLEGISEPWTGCSRIRAIWIEPIFWGSVRSNQPTPWKAKMQGFNWRPLQMQMILNFLTVLSHL